MTDKKLTPFQKWRMCDRKRSYETKSKANRAAVKKDFYVYECPVCFCWHLTKKKKKSVESFIDRLDAELENKSGGRAI